MKLSDEQIKDVMGMATYYIEHDKGYDQFNKDIKQAFPAKYGTKIYWRNAQSLYYKAKKEIDDE